MIVATDTQSQQKIESYKEVYTMLTKNITDAIFGNMPSTKYQIISPVKITNKCSSYAKIKMDRKFVESLIGEKIDLGEAGLMSEAKYNGNIKIDKHYITDKLEAKLGVMITYIMACDTDPDVEMTICNGVYIESRVQRGEYYDPVLTGYRDFPDKIMAIRWITECLTESKFNNVYNEEHEEEVDIGENRITLRVYKGTPDKTIYYNWYIHDARLKEE